MTSGKTRAFIRPDFFFLVIEINYHITNGTKASFGSTSCSRRR